MSSIFDGNPYSVHFAQYAGRLERHLRKNGISCDDADRIIEESSAIYFEKLESSARKLLRVLKKQDPADVFVDSACKAIERYLPEAKNSFGSAGEIAKAIR
jgi:hypothetical protein